MANIKSNKKSAITSKKSAVRNKKHKSMLKTTIKNLKNEISQKGDSYITHYNEAQKLIDKGVSKKVWHKNTAKRKKSSLAAIILKK